MHQSYPSPRHLLTLLFLALMLQKRMVNQNIKRLKDIGCYRGRRHIMVRHQLQQAKLGALARCWPISKLLKP
jgi:hypothetical protein